MIENRVVPVESLTRTRIAKLQAKYARLTKELANTSSELTELWNKELERTPKKIPDWRPKYGNS